MQTIGKRGEDLCAEYLLSKGYHILSRNYRHKRSEIDLICQHDELLVFVEVKYRENRYYKMTELLSISQEKRLVEAMDIYIRDNEIDCEPRFDLIFVSNQYGINKIFHFPSYIQPTL